MAILIVSFDTIKNIKFDPIGGNSFRVHKVYQLHF